MCGIAGFFQLNDASRTSMESVIRAMGDAITHRGPDSGAVWLDPEAGTAFAHRRLAIVDLSETGNQPMMSSCGRFVICYNGEGYDTDPLRADLEKAGVVFQGHSDTEVILEGCARLGVEETVGRLVGMFAIALWDRQERRLWLIRDRLGIKPLYWQRLPGGGLIFGSELKALAAHPDFSREIDRDVLAGYLRHNCVSGSMSIYKGVNKLAPGHILTLSQNDPEPSISTFWHLDDVVAGGQSDPFTGNDLEALAALEDLLSDAVRIRMMADVPLGAFLSGGIDSSTVVALMQQASTRPVKSFSIGFETEGYNEARHAAEVARHLGTDHTELYVTPQQAMDVIPKLPVHFDEPFADSSQIPTYLVSAMTREHVTVALSGDGGDELFAGYNRHIQAAGPVGRFQNIPGPLRKLAGTMLAGLSPNQWDGLFSLVPKSKRPAQAGDKMHKLAAILDASGDEVYRRLVSHWSEPEDLVIGGREAHGIIWDDSVKNRIPDLTQRMQYFDILTYLPDDILTKVDRASMAVALEARVPILDHRVVEFAWRLPNSMKIRGGQGKWLLRQLLYKYVPQSMVDRPKMGFAVPIDQWLRGPLREWAEDLLSEDMFRKHGLLHSGPVRQKWSEHLSGRRNWQYHLWDILMLHAWAETWS